MLMSTDMITSVPYANKNAVSLVGTCLVVLWPIVLQGVFFAHLPIALSKLLHRLSRMVQLLISAWPFP